MRQLTTEGQASALADAIAARNDKTDALSQDTFSAAYPTPTDWSIGPFTRDESLTYVLESQLDDPVGIGWTSASIINPSVIEADGELVLFFRASPRKESLASRIGVARRRGGEWVTDSAPAVWPTLDNELWGCEDPKVYRADGRFYLFYNGIFPITEEDRERYPSNGYPVDTVGCDINLAVSDDLQTWEKLGPIIDHDVSRLWAKGAVIPRGSDGDAVRIGGEYVMYLSEGCDGRTMVGRSTDMVEWTFDEQPYLDLSPLDGHLHEVACAVVDDEDAERLVLDFFYDDRDHRFAAAQAVYSTADPFRQLALNEGGSLSWGGLTRLDGRWSFAQGWDAPAGTRTLYFYRETETPMTDTWLFIGDSITDAGRFDDSDHLGTGYVRELAGLVRDRDVRTVNRGIGGNRAVDLRRRWQRDVLDHAPDLLSVHVGVNDTWRRFDSDDPTTTGAFEEHYRAILDAVDREVTRTVVLIEPFLVPIDAEQPTWRDDLDGKIDVVRRLAGEYGGVLVPADVRLNELAAEHGAPAIAFDGVHPSAFGHEQLARLWLDTVDRASHQGVA